MDSVTNRAESPSNATSDVLNTSSGTIRKKKALKSEYLKNNEKLIRVEELDQTTDFVEYLEFLAEYFKQLDRLDAAGRKLLHIFQEPQTPQIRLQSLKNWIINFDIWGSYMPLNAQLFDVQLARTAAYTKLKETRKQVRVMVSQKRITNGLQGNILKNLMN